VFKHRRKLSNKTGWGEQNRPCMLRALIYEGVKVKKRLKIWFCINLLSVHHQNNHFENIYILYLPLFNPWA